MFCHAPCHPQHRDPLHPHLESPEIEFFLPRDIPGIFQVYDDLVHIYVIYQVYTCHMKPKVYTWYIVYTRYMTFVKGNSSFRSNLSHSTPTRMPDRCQSNRSMPIKTSGHSHPNPKPYRLTAEAIFVSTTTSF
jgi:hypothetical protein